MFRPIAVESLGPVAVAARAFAVRGELFVTAVVKVTVALDQDAPMRVVKPRAIVAREQRRDERPNASVRRPSDLALIVPRPEIVLDAVAYASPGGVEHVSTRVAVARGTSMILSKHLEIFGDRRAASPAVTGRPATFERMPIVYERALGGVGRPENPAGVGCRPDADGKTTLPNVVAGDGTKVEPAGYGAISADWPLRRQLRGRLNAEIDDAPFVELGADFANDYFQSAPADQQIDEWRSGDLLVMTNLHPEWSTLRVHFPILKGVALLETGRGDNREVALRPDTLFVEPHMLRGEIVFRGATRVSRADLEGLRVIGTVEEPGIVGGASERWTVRPKAGGGPLAPGSALETTAVLDPQPQATGGLTSAGTLVMEPSPPEPRPPPRGSEHGVSGTLVIDPEPPGAAALDHEPFAHPTLELEVDSAPASLPFAKRTKRTRSSGTLKAAGQAPAVPGAPWSPENLDKPVPARGDAHSTLVLSEEPPRQTAKDEEAPAPAPKKTDRSPASPSSWKRKPTTATPKSSLWREDSAPPAEPSRAPPAKTPEPKNDSRDSLYKKFKR